MKAWIEILLAGLANVTGNWQANLPVETRAVTVTVRQAGPGATMVSRTVVHGCGTRPTRVGGGANAF